MTRWLSSNIGEGLILDLRTAVFDHVQRMPVAFFTRTRTRTGALVSRLGNDQLMARGGRYAELYETQFGSQPDPEDVVAA
ncbi:MAG: hypothetical protein QOF66_6201 [Mycobacterium sp.]|nr:transporter, ATP-binding/permease protein [Mycobacterium sp.]MDT5057835.1 hypothetical protein [Mycobacterium sp.]